MSRHPGNPFWHQERDIPIVIYRQDWNRAVAEGHVTVEHILQRLQGMAEHARGSREGAVVAYDADGFIISLIAAGLRMEDGTQIRVNPDDHTPPHAHIVIPGKPEMKLTINLETFTIDQNLPDGWSKKGKRVEEFTRANQTKLLDWWSNYQADEPTTK